MAEHRFGFGGMMDVCAEVAHHANTHLCAAAVEGCVCAHVWALCPPQPRAGDACGARGLCELGGRALQK